MPSKSKRKGNTFERECVDIALKHGLFSKRAYASNGLSLGKEENVDIIINNYTGQCKRRKKLGNLFKPEPNIDFQIVREDRGDTYVILQYDLLMKLLSDNKYGNPN